MHPDIYLRASTKFREQSRRSGREEHGAKTPHETTTSRHKAAALAACVSKAGRTSRRWPPVLTGTALGGAGREDADFSGRVSNSRTLSSPSWEKPWVPVCHPRRLRTRRMEGRAAENQPGKNVQECSSDPREKEKNVNQEGKTHRNAGWRNGATSKRTRLGAGGEKRRRHSA